MTGIGQLLLHAGWVAWVLVALCWVMWVLVGMRSFILGTGAAAESRAADLLKDTLQSAPSSMWAWLVTRHTEQLQRYRFGLRVVIAVAPLLGLLGTVSGMVEMFVALAGTAGAQEGSVARGISRALFTTQLGLVVSVPGLIAARLLERRELRIAAVLQRTHHALTERGAS